MGSFRPSTSASLLICFVSTLTLILVGNGNAETIQILQFGDIYSQLLPFYPNFNPSNDFIPRECINATGTDISTCIGGIKNILSLMDKLQNRTTADEKIRISTGNLLGGENGYLPLNRGWSAFNELVSLYYKPNVMTYGIKEFEAGLAQTLNYYNGVDQTIHPTTLTMANVNCLSPPGQDEQIFCDAIKNNNVVPHSGVGIIGFINPNVERLASPGRLTFKSAVEAIKDVTSASNLQSFIAIGDGTFELAKQIIDASPKVKLVMYSQTFGTIKNMTDNYPEPHGHGFIAAVPKWGAGVGEMNIAVSNGIITSITGDIHVPVDAVYSNPKLDKNLTDWMVEVTKASGHWVGRTVFQLEGGEKCWRDECNLGNVVADAVVHCAYNSSKFVNKPMSTPLVSLWQGGSLFSDIVPQYASISELDVHRWLPYHNRIFVAEVTGANLFKIFETSGTGLLAKNDPSISDWGQFLQVSNGLQVYYKTEGPLVEVEKIRILHEEDDKPVMKDIDKDEKYGVVIPSFLKEGRSVYGFTQTEGIFEGAVDINKYDDECLQDYIEGLRVVSVGFEERIWINALPDGGGSGGGGGGWKGQSKTVTVILTVVFTLIFVAAVYIGLVYIYPKLSGKTHPHRFD